MTGALRPLELGYARADLRRPQVGERFVLLDRRAAHERFWAGHAIDDETRLVAERFRLTERLG